MPNILSSVKIIFILANVFIVNTKSSVSETAVLETVSNNKTSDPIFTNKVAPIDSYSMYKHLMEVKEDMTGGEREPKVVTVVKMALQKLLEAAVHGLLKGFLPHVERQRREATEEKRTYLDIAINTVGALLGRQQCSEIIACRTGKYVGHKVPGASMAVLMLEGIVPKALSSWFGVIKTAVIDRSEDCDEDYMCSLVDSDDDENT
eukprot:GFUD01021235.1.p1 GENE.GFUD01021235.1~~GFUD01021235.1.p1  ORF type:complete len:224 (-),score=52.72 GFUD01021235.1:276-890(-)